MTILRFTGFRLFVVCAVLAACAATVVAGEVKVRIVNYDTREPIEFAAVCFEDLVGGTVGGYTDNEGLFRHTLKPGNWTMTVSMVGFKPLRVNKSIADRATSFMEFGMVPDNSLREVVVTARESLHSTSASIIDTTAMQHLQPSSFTDLLELLPGNVSKDPSTATPNIISLRTASNVTPSDDYMSGAIGTSFIVDGVPLNNNSGMQATIDTNHSGHNTEGKGVDMRVIGTDDIEQVEIVRGIASAEYGELTSGLVNIKRKSGVTRLEARLKADTKSQLFYVGKGFAMPGDKWIMNMGLGYLDSRSDPRNARENFKRINASVRSNKRWHSDLLDIAWQASLNYTGAFERDDNDPDLTVNNTIDKFKTANHAISWNNTLTITPVNSEFWRLFSFVSGISYSRERLEQTRHVAPSRIMPMPVSLTQGGNYVGYLPMLYLARLSVEGDPLTAFVKGSAEMRVTTDRYTNGIKAGVEWNMAKNYGRGHVYDLTRPITASTGTRPRAFSDIPAMHNLSAFVESRNILYVGRHTLALTLGLRETQLLHLDSRYKLSGKPYLDPRFTMTWTLPSLFIGKDALVPELSAGWGLQTKMPIAAFLYPEPVYTDFEQLNYYHDIERYRVMNVMTYIEDMTNFDLLAARNKKWELRADLSFKENRMSITYFREDMKDGFRNTGFIHRYTFRRYDASAFDPAAADRAPVIDELPFLTENYQTVKNHTTNGSTTRKEGVEFTLQSRRIKLLHTRFTVNGAWLRTTNCNSQPLWYKPGIMIDGKEIPYIGLYDDIDGSVYQSFNTNFMFDTDLPTLGLRFSMAMQCMWFTSRRTIFRDGRPIAYIGADDDISSPRPYTDDCLNDPALRQLIRHYSSGAFDEYRVPAEASFNVKATKSFWANRINVAIYVNRLFNIAPDYLSNGVTVRRFSSPYFGMEIYLKI